jgi:outer membrane protein assembly factor BamB
VVLSAVTCLLIAGPTWAAQGDVVWENRGQSAPYAVPYVIDGERNVVVAAGRICAARSFSTCDWFVRAHDAGTGGTLWEDRLDGGGLRDEARAVAVDGGRAFAAGVVRTVATRNDFLVRAYDLDSGILLWERRVDRGGWNDDASAIVAQDGRVFVAGSLGSSRFSSSLCLFALDAKTGVTLWESETAVPPNPSGFAFAGAVAISLQGERIFVAGDVSSAAASGNSVIVQARDARTGAVLWDQRIPDTSFGFTQFGVMAVGGNRLVVGADPATSDPDLGIDSGVYAFDVITGTLVWRDQVHRQAGGATAGLAFGAGKLFSYGWDCDGTVFNCHGDVRAYDSETGILQWEDRFTGPGGDIGIPLPRAAFQVHRDQVFIGTSLLNLQGDYEWTVRSYNADDGSVRWNNQIDDGGVNDGLLGLKVLGGRLYAAGLTDRPDGGYDFAVRAYTLGEPGGDDDG